jgi:hypothetical protein
MKTTVAAAFFLVVGLAGQALAQGKGGKGGKFGPEDLDRFMTRLHWYPSLEKAVTADSDEVDKALRKTFQRDDGADKKYILVYVRPVGEDREPGEFQNPDVTAAAQGSWRFVRMDFDKDNAHIKAWGFKGAPALVACDIKGNDFMKSPVLSNDQIKRVLGGTPEMIQRYEQKIRADFASALKLLPTDEGRAVKLLGEIIAGGKQGYKEVAEAHAKLNEQAQASFRRGELAESAGFDAGVEYYDDLARIYKGTPPGARAEVRAARLDHERGQTRRAVERLQAVLKLDLRVFKTEMEEAQKALDEVSKAGK